MRYLGIESKKLKIAVFDFTSCEGCELQFANKEETLGAFLNAISICQFREITSEKNDDYDIAFIEGSVSRADEVDRLLAIRKKAETLVALGSCACFGGVNRLKNSYPIVDANKIVYGDTPKETMKVKSVKEIVSVDMEIPGCPVSKDEVERIVQHLIYGIPFNFPVYPVCYKCKKSFTICRFDMGELCLGPITGGGCNAPCPVGGSSCLGCRGPVKDANLEEFYTMASEKGFSVDHVKEYLALYGGFREFL